MRVTKRKKKTKNFSSQRLTKYLPVMIILLSLTIILGSTFAYFTDKVDKGSDLTFSKVELSDETTVGIDGTLKDALPGSPIVEDRLQFSKSIDSEPIYVRAKLSFSLSDSLSTEDKNLLKPYIMQLQGATDYGIIQEEQNGAKWSDKENNYIYLMTSDGQNLKQVDTNDIYVLSQSIVLPRSLTQLEDNAQYMNEINFHFSFQAIQVENVSIEVEQIKELFNKTFPESEKEKIVPYTVSFINQDSSIYLVQEVTPGQYLSAPEDLESTSSKIFTGYYLDEELTTKFDFENTKINENTNIYLGFKNVTSPSLFTFDGNVLTGYIGQEFDIVIPSSYSIDENGDYCYGVDFKVEQIGSYAFKSNYILETVEILNGINRVEFGAFQYCTQLHTILFPETLTYMSSYIFTNCRMLKNVNIPESLTFLYHGIFEGCYSLEYIDIPNTIEEFGADVFSDCINLKEVTLPINLKEIPIYTFENCYQLTSIIIPEKITSIGTGAFNGCNKLVEILNLSDMDISVGQYGIGDNVKQIIKTEEDSNLYVGENEYSDYIFYVSDKQYLQSQTLKTGGVIYTPSKGETLSHYYNKKSNILIDNYTIGQYAFLNNSYGGICLSDAVVGIEKNAFYSAGNLISIVISKNISSIGENVFGKCNKLIEICNLSNIEIKAGDYGTLSTVKVIDDIKFSETYYYEDSYGKWYFYNKENDIYLCSVVYECRDLETQ